VEGRDTTKENAPETLGGQVPVDRQDAAGHQIAGLDEGFGDDHMGDHAAHHGDQPPVAARPLTSHWQRPIGEAPLQTTPPK